MFRDAAENAAFGQPTDNQSHGIAANDDVRPEAVLHETLTGRAELPM